MSSNNLSTDEELYAVDSGKPITLQMCFSTKVYRMVFNLIGEGEGIKIYSRKKYTYYNAADGITPNTKYDIQEYDNISTVDDEIYKLLRVLRSNGYQLLSPKR